MGWYKIENTEDLVGDDAFNILRDATIQVVQLYLQAFGRPPSRSEWQVLLHSSLEPFEELSTAHPEPMLMEGRRPQKVEIVLEE